LAIAGDDREHVLNVSGLYELPLGPGKRFLNRGGMLAKNLLNGWQFEVFSSTRAELRLGSVPTAASAYWKHCQSCRGQSLTVDYNNYYKACPSSTPAPSPRRKVRVGDAPRRIEVSAHPSTPMRTLIWPNTLFQRARRRELRMEFFNILNRMQICDPETNVDNANFGESTRLRLPEEQPRTGQAFFKVSF